MKNVTLPIEQAAKKYPSIRSMVSFASDNGAKIIAHQPKRNARGKIVDHIFKVKTCEGVEKLNRSTLMLLLLLCMK